MFLSSAHTMGTGSTVQLASLMFRDLTKNRGFKQSSLVGKEMATTKSAIQFASTRVMRMMTPSQSCGSPDTVAGCVSSERGSRFGGEAFLVWDAW
jgi:hypothetical protein